MIGALRGMGAVQERMLPGLQGFEITSSPPIHAPLAVFQGRHDAGAVPSLSVELAARMNAELVWFEDSAHTPHEEEPAKFREALLRFTGKRGAR
jgi:pimeloyl-ACP methyl ester carboxylesterase